MMIVKRKPLLINAVTDQLFPWLNYGPQVIDILNIMLNKIFSGKRTTYVILRKELLKWKHIG